MEGDKKYSPPRGTTKSCLGRASDAVRLLGSVPPIDLGSLTFCPIYILLRLENGEKNNRANILTIASKPSFARGKFALLAHDI